MNAQPGACTPEGSNMQVVLHLQEHYIHCKLTSGLLRLGTGLEVGVDVYEESLKKRLQSNTIQVYICTDYNLEFDWKFH